MGVDERTLTDTAVLEPARTVRTDVERVMWADQIPPDVLVSGHVYDVQTGIVTTVVDAKKQQQPAGLPHPKSVPEVHARCMTAAASRFPVAVPRPAASAHRAAQV